MLQNGIFLGISIFIRRFTKPLATYNLAGVSIAAVLHRNWYVKGHSRWEEKMCYELVFKENRDLETNPMPDQASRSVSHGCYRGAAYVYPSD